VTGTPAGVAMMPLARPPPTPFGESVTLPELCNVVQEEAVVLFWLVPSLNISHTVYCWFPVTGIEAVAGVNVKPFDVAAVTVNVAERDMPP